ncbi:MAG: hypothetical protein HY851_10875 [candidate division Zixibacteria bacterium]|nr:hypothetical protein [candidate division Zixibacteria bacterium]
MKHSSMYVGLALTLVLPAMLSAQGVVWDTISTGCIRLVVGNNGEMGHNGIGRANMDYVAFGGDCDTTATVYLRSGGPFVIRYDGSTYIYSSALRGNAAHGFTATALMSRFSSPGYSGLSTGVLLNKDSTIGVQVSYYAPTAGGDVCKFIIQKTVFTGGPVVPPYSWYIFGQFVDWDIPSQVPSFNTAEALPARRLNYLQGTGLSSSGCPPHTRRIAAGINLSYRGTWGYNDSCLVSGVGNGPVFRADSLASYEALSNSDAGKAVWTRLNSGLPLPAGQLDLVGSSLFSSYHLPVTAYSALITINDGDTAELRAVADAARKWHADHLRPGCPNLVSACCLENSNDGRTGNVDCDPYGGVDISDLSRMIDYLFLEGGPLCCVGAADLIWDDNVDIADLTDLIDYLYIRFSPTAPCR